MFSSSYQVIQAGTLPPATETGAHTCSTMAHAWLRRARMELLISASLKLFRFADSGRPSDMGALGFCVDLRMLFCSTAPLPASAGAPWEWAINQGDHVIKQIVIN